VAKHLYWGRRKIWKIGKFQQRIKHKKYSSRFVFTTMKRYNHSLQIWYWHTKYPFKKNITYKYLWRRWRKGHYHIWKLHRFYDKESFYLFWRKRYHVQKSYFFRHKFWHKTKMNSMIYNDVYILRASKGRKYLDESTTDSVPVIIKIKKKI